MKDIYITAIEMPGNIQKHFYELQSILFRENGIPSARLFPPIIPLLPGKLTEGIFSMISNALFSIRSFKATPLIQYRKGIFYSPIEIVLKDPASGPTTLLPYYQPANDKSNGLNIPADLFLPHIPVIFLAYGGYGISSAAGNQYTQHNYEGTYEKLSWKKIHIVEISVHYATDEYWWKDIQWEYSKSVKTTCGDCCH